MQLSLVHKVSHTSCFPVAISCIFYFNVLSQGEDVSMGIWMAAVGPKRYQVSQSEEILFNLMKREHACCSKQHKISAMFFLKKINLKQPLD